MPVSRVRMVARVLKTMTDTSVFVLCVAVHKAETRPHVVKVSLLWKTPSVSSSRTASGAAAATSAEVPLQTVTCICNKGTF